MWLLLLLTSVPTPPKTPTSSNLGVSISQALIRESSNRAQVKQSQSHNHHPSLASQASVRKDPKLRLSALNPKPGSRVPERSAARVLAVRPVRALSRFRADGSAGSGYPRKAKKDSLSQRTENMLLDRM